MKSFLHIIAFDIPYPANYGGAIDVFYRIKSLHQAGVGVILHCFLYNRQPNDELEKYCTKVYYYPRKTGFVQQLNVLPYSVVSRKNPKLIQHLLHDDYPILFEGLMSCYYLNHKQLKGRFKIYREANIEHTYYWALAKAGRGFRYKLYHAIEAAKLCFFEKILKHAQLILAVSDSDRVELQTRFPLIETVFLPCFHAQQSIDMQLGSGNYLMYHANLSVAENEKAALFLCTHVFSKVSHHCIVAGYNPSEYLRKTIQKYDNIQLVENPDEAGMQHLIKNAHIHVLITFQATGLKLKLLHVLFAGRHVIANAAMLQGTNLENLCVVAESPTEMIAAIQLLMRTNVDNDLVQMRIRTLKNHYSNSVLANRIINLVF